MYRLFAQRDNEGISELFDPEIEWVQMEGFPRGGRYVGADAIFDGVFAGFREQWECCRRAVPRCERVRGGAGLLRGNVPEHRQIRAGGVRAPDRTQGWSD